MVHVPSRWSLGVKNFTNCGYYPWQLAYTSSLLKRETKHKVRMFDGVLKAWCVETYFQHIAEEAPDWLIMESSTRTLREDLRLAAKVREAFGTRLIFTGQHPMAQPEEVLKTADYVCIGEYEYAVLELVQGQAPQTITGVYPNPRRELLDVNDLPFPEDDDVSRLEYHEPNCHYRQIQMYASRGCPRRCNFCAAATLYYDELNWRPRNVASVVEEIRTLRQKYPEMEGVFFDEEVHNIKRSFNIELARSIREAGLHDLKYEAMCEYHSLDEEAMEEMAKAGYYKIRFGIETASDAVAERMTLGKKHDPKKMHRILTHGKQLGLMFYATFSMGGVGSSRKEDQKTVDLIYDLSSQGLLDEIQVSINTPQPGTDFFNEAVKNGWIVENAPWEEYDGNGKVVVNYPHYPRESIQAMFQEALSAFDRGKEAACKNSENAFSMDSIPTGARVLLLRSVRPWMIHLILESLSESRSIRADLLGQDSMIGEFKSSPFAGRFHSYGEGFFSVDTLVPDLVEELRSCTYDYILVPLANNHIDGFQNVIEVAQELGGRNVLGVLWDGNILPLENNPSPIQIGI